MVLGYILLFSFLGSIASLIGGIILLWKENWAKKISLSLVSFAAGTLIGVAFLDLLPQALELGLGSTMFIFTIMGILLFFVLEKFLLWHHHHSGKKETEEHSHAFLILVGDGIHNFIDGIIIAASFVINIPLGIATSIAVVFHEIPQEIGDFGVLLQSGMDRMKVLTYNLIVASLTIVGALTSYFYFLSIESVGGFLLPFAAGVFIYIATADLIPETHKESKWSNTIVQTFLFILGIFAIWGVGFIF